MPGTGESATIVPTAAGRAERMELDRRSDALAETLLRPLDADERARLVAAMAEVERLVTRSRTTIGVAAANDPDVRHCFERYAAELNLRFDRGFDVGRSNRMDMADLTPPKGLVLLARMGADAIGCGALMFLPGGVAELKRIWIAPRARGIGLGRRMLHALEQHARENQAQPWRAWRRTAAWLRRSRCIALKATGRYPRSTTSRTPTTGSRSLSAPCESSSAAVRRCPPPPAHDSRPVRG